ncbi:pre-peptidase C-terminal domain-containing protein [Austwickia chelonae]|uniref:Putative peptidase n=1 Tax=Austwickia chelonae NBRC 105200 TaxID=1184607 RepID=K6VPS8_9MICO|nr:S8 family serine peptidase [Austwickia chelonae]GAB78744.1 putative peptidase [Austwickia chelonae NBRC 105200]SEW35200.1 pre-peptidase C-terminal domain-containing protein [Austwickia chelonae]
MSVHTTRRGLAAILAVGLSAVGMNTASAETTPTPVAPVTLTAEGGKDTPQAEKMSTHSQELLLEAESSGKTKVTVMTLTDKDKTQEVVGQLKSLGASVGYVHEKTGYVRATLDTASARKVTKIAQVKKVDLDEMLTVPVPVADQPSGSAQNVRQWTGPNASTPDSNPYMPTNETGAIAFRKAHPTFDGRQATIGVLDSGVDLDHPALQKTTTGERKIVNWVTATDPLSEADGTWRPMLTKVSGSSAKFGGAEWKLPNRPGADFAINVFRESAANGSREFEGDLDRDGSNSSSWGILYDYNTGDIWVDVNANHDFTDDAMMRPYKERFDIGHFGKDDPATDVRESMPFVVEFRKDVDLTPAGPTFEGKRADFVNIGLIASSHGTHVAGIAAGHKLFGGQMNGAAPGAKIVSSKACVFAGGCTSVALSEGMIDLVANQRVDIVNMSIGGLPALNDGNNTRSYLYQRLINEYGVQLFVSAGNEGPGVNTVGDPSVAPDVISVAAGASKDTWMANYGAKVTASFWAQNYSSRGPREDGGFKPDIIAPGSAISTIPMVFEGGPVPEAGYPLPAGYAMFNGTSMSSPQAAGAATLLISGARQSDVAVTPKQLRTSIYSTAQFIPGLEAAAQGNGLIRVDKAWDILSKSPKAENAYEISAPVCTPLAASLKVKNRGEGLYNRCSQGEGGQRIGEEKTYEVVVKRTAGPADQSRHQLKWVGNDGTFSAPTQVDLPVGTPVKVKVTAKPETMGAHSAILNLDVEATPWLDGQMMTEIVAAASLKEKPFVQKMTGSVERVRTQSLFVAVPKGTKNLQVNLSGIAAGSLTRFLAVNPYGLPVEKPSGRASCYTNHTDAKLCHPTSRAYQNPMPGVWEFLVESARTTPTTQNPFTLTAATQGVSVEPAAQTVETAVIGKPVPLSWTVRNDMGAAKVTAQGGPLGSSAKARPTIKAQEKKTFTVDVPAGASRLDVKIGNPSDETADLDLFVKNAVGREVGKSAKADSEETVTLINPAPGPYTVIVEGYAVSAPGGTQFDYLDVYFGSSLGTLRVSSTPKDLATGEQMKVTGELVAKSEVAQGRQLFGELKVVNTEGSVLGIGHVFVGSVLKTEPSPSPTSTTTSPTTAPVPTPTTSVPTPVPPTTAPPSPSGTPVVTAPPALWS